MYLIYFEQKFTFINYSNTTKNNIGLLFIDFSASRRKPSSGLTSGAGRQYVKACPICGSTGSSPCLDSCCGVFLIHITSLMSLPALSVSRSTTLAFTQSITWFSLQTWSVNADLLQILAALVFSALVKIPVMLSTSLRCSFAPSGLPVSPT